MTKETFFVTYNTGEYDDFYEHVYAIDAESKEALYVEIHNAFDAYVAYHKKYREERAKVEEFRPKSNNASEKQYEAYYQKLYEFFDTYPYIADFVVYGYKIAPFDETMVCEKNDAFDKSGLEIHSVSEYIEFVRPQKKELGILNLFVHRRKN